MATQVGRRSLSAIGFPWQSRWDGARSGNDSGLLAPDPALTQVNGAPSNQRSRASNPMPQRCTMLVAIGEVDGLP